MEKFTELIAKTVEVLGIQAARLWPQVVLIIWIEAVASLLLAILLLGMACHYLRKLVYKAVETYTEQKAGGGYTDIEGYYFGITLLSIVCSIIILFIVSQGPHLIATLFAPEAATILKFVGKL